MNHAGSEGCTWDVEFSRDREIYEPSGRGPGAMGYPLPFLCWDQQSGGFALLEKPLISKYSMVESTGMICNLRTVLLTCLASFVLQGSILTLDPGEKAEMARQWSCCRIRGSISSHLWKRQNNLKTCNIERLCKCGVSLRHFFFFKTWTS